LDKPNSPKGVEMEWYNRACRAGQNVSSLLPLHKLFGSWALLAVHSLPFLAGKRMCGDSFFLSFRGRRQRRNEEIPLLYHWKELGFLSLTVPAPFSRSCYYLSMQSSADGKDSKRKKKLLEQHPSRAGKKGTRQMTGGQENRLYSIGLLLPD